MEESRLLYFINNCPNLVQKKLEEVRFNFGDKLLVQGKKSENVYIILEGVVKTYYEEFNGHLYIEDIDIGVAIFGELEALINKPIVTTVEAVSESKTLKLSNKAFVEWMSLDSEFAIYISRIIAQRNYDCSKRQKVNALYPLKYRIMYMILNTLYKKNITITKDLLVEGVGSNIRSVNRIINELIASDILEYKNGVIKIKNMDELISEIENKE